MKVHLLRISALPVYAPIAIALLVIFASQAPAAVKVLSFDNAPQFGHGDNSAPLEGEWGWFEDGLCNTGETDCSYLVPAPSPPEPMWNSGGYITPIGQETPALAFNRYLGPTGVTQLGPPTVNTTRRTITAFGVVLYDNTSWGDVSNATHVTLDVKGSFADTGGIALILSHNKGRELPDGPDAPYTAPWWSWGAAASVESVGANPGNVTEWTTITIPINKPTKQTSGSAPFDPEEEGTYGNWGTWANFTSDAEMVQDWDTAFANLNEFGIYGLPPDAQIDNVGFVIPDVGLAGDFDEDGDVDGNDFLTWQRNPSVGDLADWQNGYAPLVATLGSIPEPSTAALALGVCLSLLSPSRRKR